MGYVAEESLECDLLGNNSNNVTDRLYTKNIGLYETLSKLNFGMFHGEQKKASVRARGRNLSPRTDRDLFARLLIIGQGRRMDL